MTDRVTWLVREVDDLLDVSSVGLYEFFWLLRGAYPELGSKERLEVAGAALANLRSDGRSGLAWLSWPAEEPVTGDVPTQPRVQDWDDPRAGQPYLALTRQTL